MRLTKIFVLILAVLAARIPESGAGLSVAPTVTELALEPDETRAGTYRVTNTGPGKSKVFVHTEDWMGRMFGTPDELPVDEWLKLAPAEMELEPGQTGEIQYTARAPSTFTKEKVAQVFFTVQEYTNVRSRIGVIFYLSPRGQENLQAQILSLEAAFLPAQGDQGPMLGLHFEISNESDVHIRPRGQAVLADGQSGETVQTWDLRKIPGVYPRRTFRWTEYLDLGSHPAGEYQVNMSLDYGHTYGQQQIMEKTASVKPASLETKTP